MSEMRGERRGGRDGERAAIVTKFRALSAGCFVGEQIAAAPVTETQLCLSVSPLTTLQTRGDQKYTPAA